MITIREEQLRVIEKGLETPSAAARASRMVADLEDLGYFQRGSPALQALLQEFRRQREGGDGGRAGTEDGERGWAALATDAEEEKALRTLVTEELARADRYGIETPLLQLRFVGCTFRFGLEASRAPTARKILKDRRLDESARVCALVESLRKA